MIQNRNLTRAASKRYFTHQITMATTALQAKGFVDMENDIRITGITWLYVVASDTGAWQEIEVGTASDPDHYSGLAGENSKAIGYTKAQTLDSSDLVPAGTALIIRRANTTAGANTGVIDVIVQYQIIDKIPQP